ncbi:hypothetical protein TcCL_NonESM01111 [Trypanosoma cruzi]|nr:hypothetical protein TcCL_NonESM01111 [Trypanosoma cruzi]
MPGIHPPPPPPARRHRRPFMTSFIADVLPFLPARDVLVCAGVCRVWREEANSLSLWRELLTNDPATAMHAYRRLTLHAIQEIVLQRASMPGIGKNYLEFGSTADRDGSLNRLEHTLETGPRFISENDFRKDCGVRGFSFGLPFLQIEHKEIAEANPGNGAIDLSFKKRAGSTMKVMESLQLQMMLLKEHISKSTRVLDALRQQLPTRDAVLLHEECFRKWKRLKIFEELVVNSLYSMDTYTNSEFPTASIPIGFPHSINVIHIPFFFQALKKTIPRNVFRLIILLPNDVVNSILECRKITNQFFPLSFLEK